MPKTLAAQTSCGLPASSCHAQAQPMQSEDHFEHTHTPATANTQANTCMHSTCKLFVGKVLVCKPRKVSPTAHAPSSLQLKESPDSSLLQVTVMEPAHLQSKQCNYILYTFIFSNCSHVDVHCRAIRALSHSP